MKQLYLDLLLVLILLIPSELSGNQQIPPSGIPHLDSAAHYYNIGVKEKTAHNDGVYVKKFLRYVGLSEGYPWCASFSSYCIGVCKDIITKIKTASAIKSVNKDTYTEKEVRMKRVHPEPGTLAIWRHGNTASGHIGIVYCWNDISGQIIEGNSGNKVSFNVRKLEPRNYFRIRYFTPIYYKESKQKEIDNIVVEWLNNVKEGNLDFATTR